MRHVPDCYASQSRLRPRLYVVSKLERMGTSSSFARLIDTDWTVRYNNRRWLAVARLSVCAGDFNGDGAVNAADYVVWRKGLGTTYAPTDFNSWRAHFGQTAGTGSGAISRIAVPEPALLLIAIVGLYDLASLRKKKKSRRPCRIIVDPFWVDYSGQLIYPKM
jgi:hypothetical protein